MKKLTVLLFLLISFYSKGQTLTSEESYRNYFVANKDSIDPIEDVQFLPTDVIGVYLYKNYFPEIQQYSKAKAIISKGSEMEYTYDFPDDFLRIKFGDTYEEGTRVVNILKWSKSFPENKQ